MLRSLKFLTASCILLALIVPLFAAESASRSGSITSTQATPEVTAEATEGTPVIGQTNPLGDLADFNLKIVKTEVVDKLTDESYGSSTTISATSGYKLVVVTMVGTAPYNSELVMRTDEFAAVWVEDPTDGSYGIAFSGGLGDEDSWSIPDENSISVRFLYPDASSTVTLKLAFILPNNVTSFNVQFPATAADQATIK